MACIVFEEPNVRGNNQWERISSSSMCVCESALALTFGASGPVLSVRLRRLCACVFASWHVCICAFCQCRAGMCREAEHNHHNQWNDEMRMLHLSFTNASPDWAWLHDTSVHRGIRVSLPSCLPVWFEGFKSLAAQSYIVLLGPTMFAESILMIPFRTLSVMSLGSNKQISVLICMSFKHLHLYLEDIWAVCGTWRKWMNHVV